MTAHCLNVVGLILNMLGAFVGFFFAFPQPDLSRGSALALMQGGNDENEGRRKLYRGVSLGAFGLMFVGFAAQLWALFLP